MRNGLRAALAVVAFGLGGAAACAGAQPAIVARSPFLPPASEAQAGQTQGPNGVELHGIMSTASGTKYNIYDPARRTSLWLGLDQSADGIVVRSANPQTKSVTLAVNGQTVSLVLQQAKTTGRVMSAPEYMPMSLRPTPEDEQRRLQAVAEEVRRRRLLREQAERQQAQQR